MPQTTTLVVQFGDDVTDIASSHLSAEIDSRDDGRNGGVTQFEPTDKVYFHVFKSDNITSLQTYASAFSAGMTGEVDSITKEDVLVFAGTREASISVPVESGFTYKWLGNNLGTITVSGTKAIASDGGPNKVGVAKVSYNASGYVGEITSGAELDGETDFSIAVLIVGNES